MGINRGDSNRDSLRYRYLEPVLITCGEHAGMTGTVVEESPAKVLKGRLDSQKKVKLALPNGAEVWFQSSELRK